MPTTPIPSVPLESFPGPLLTVDELAQLYRVSRWTIWRQVKAGTFRPKPWSTEKPYRWLKTDIEKDLSRRREGAANQLKVANAR